MPSHNEINELNFLAYRQGPLIDSFFKDEASSYDGVITYEETDRIIKNLELIEKDVSKVRTEFHNSMKEMRRLRELLGEGNEIRYWFGIDCNNDKKIEIEPSLLPKILIRSAIEADKNFEITNSAKCKTEDLEDFKDDKCETKRMTHTKEFKLYLKHLQACHEKITGKQEVEAKTDKYCVNVAAEAASDLLNLAGALIIFGQNTDLLLYIIKDTATLVNKACEREKIEIPKDSSQDSLNRYLAGLERCYERVRVTQVTADLPTDFNNSVPLMMSYLAEIIFQSDKSFSFSDIIDEIVKALTLLKPAIPNQLQP